MNAIQAAKKTKAAIARQKKEERLKELQQERESKKRVATALAQLDWYMREVNKRIREAINAGVHKANYDFGDDDTGRALMHAVRKRLEKRKFIVHTGYYSETHDYGDFNAPCVVEESGFNMTISWGA